MNDLAYGRINNMKERVGEDPNPFSITHAHITLKNS